jgi:hypothetical protein
MHLRIYQYLILVFNTSAMYLIAFEIPFVNKRMKI